MSYMYQFFEGLHNSSRPLNTLKKQYQLLYPLVASTDHVFHHDKHFYNPIFNVDDPSGTETTLSRDKFSLEIPFIYFSEPADK